VQDLHDALILKADVRDTIPRNEFLETISKIERI
jgi:hypothetical protein